MCRLFIDFMKSGAIQKGNNDRRTIAKEQCEHCSIKQWKDGHFAIRIVQGNNEKIATTPFALFKGTIVRSPLVNKVKAIQFASSNGRTDIIQILLERSAVNPTALIMKRFDSFFECFQIYHKSVGLQYFLHSFLLDTYPLYWVRFAASFG